MPLFIIIFHPIPQNDIQLVLQYQILKNATSLCYFVCSKKCWQPTKISIKSKSRLSLVIQLQRWEKDYKSQQGDVGVIVKWLKLLLAFQGAERNSLSQCRFQEACCSSSFIVPLRAGTSLDIWLEGLAPPTDPYLREKSCWKRMSNTHPTFSLCTLKEKVLWCGRQCSVQSQRRWLHLTIVKPWRAGHLYKLSKHFLNAAEEGGKVDGCLEPDPCYQRYPCWPLQQVLALCNGSKLPFESPGASHAPRNQLAPVVHHLPNLVWCS